VGIAAAMALQWLPAVLEYCRTSGTYHSLSVKEMLDKAHEDAEADPPPGLPLSTAQSANAAAEDPRTAPSQLGGADDSQSVAMIDPIPAHIPRPASEDSRVTAVADDHAGPIIEDITEEEQQRDKAEDVVLRDPPTENLCEHDVFRPWTKGTGKESPVNQSRGNRESQPDAVHLRRNRWQTFTTDANGESKWRTVTDSWATLLNTSLGTKGSGIRGSGRGSLGRGRGRGGGRLSPPTRTVRFEDEDPKDAVPPLPMPNVPPTFTGALPPSSSVDPDSALLRTVANIKVDEDTLARHAQLRQC
jgi:hypothetical protein